MSICELSWLASTKNQLVRRNQISKKTGKIGRQKLTAAVKEGLSLR